MYRLYKYLPALAILAVVVGFALGAFILFGYLFVDVIRILEAL